MGLIDSIIGAESGGNPNAANPRSSASGLGQFIDSTWVSTIRSARPDLAEGKTDAELLTLKTNPDLSRQMTEAYANQNGQILSKAGHPVTPGSTYLAHFAGPQGAVSVLGADPSTPIDRVLTPAAINANPFLKGMTAGDLRAWADRKMGGAQGASPPQPVNRVASAIMGQAAPQPGPPQPGFANQIMGQDVMPPQQQSPQMPEIQPMQASPIQFAQRRAPDLTKLRAMFKAPDFYRG